MSPNLQRAHLLLEQSRPQEAETYARQAIEENVEDSAGYVALAVAQLCQDRPKEAIASAQQAIGVDPENYYAHYILGKAYFDNRQVKQAEAALKTACEIFPEDADVWGLMAAIEAQKREWNRALECADNGLRIDSENTGCVLVRAQALGALKRGGEAHEILDYALSRQPDSAITHYQKGVSCLQSGDSAKAMEHLCEALRLDPELEPAKAALVEALKARYRVYAWFLKYVFFMSALKPRTRFGVIIGGYFAQRIGREALLSAGYPMAADTVLGLYLLLVLFTWSASSLFNLLLFVHPMGKYALSDKEKRISVAVGAAVLGGIGLGATYFITGYGAYGAAALASMFLLVPFANLGHAGKGWKRWGALAFAGVAAALALGAAGLAVTGIDDALASDMAIWCMVLCGVYTWIASLFHD